MMYGQRQGQKPGTILAGRYRLDAMIGAGGFAITYRGTNLDNGVLVAVKEYCPLDGVVEPERGKQRFIREAGILREFDYLQGIVSVRDVFEEGGTAYLVMDYIDGITLKDYMKEYGTFKWDALVQMLEPVMRSLTKIHRREVIHCDISPDNLIIGMDNQLWLIDFGAMQYEDAGSERTVIVKQGYAPVEQYYSDGSVFDGKIGSWTDVYALAATMYMGFSGERPRASVERMNGGKTLADAERRALAGVLKDWQIEVLMKGMAVHKSERYGTMDEFLEALSYEPEDDFTKVPEKKMPERNIQRDMQRMLAVLLLMVLVLSGLMVYLLFQSDRTRSGQVNDRIVTDGGSGQQAEETDAPASAQHAKDSQTVQETETDETPQQETSRDTDGKAGAANKTTGADAGQEAAGGSGSTDGKAGAVNKTTGAGASRTSADQTGSTVTGQEDAGNSGGQQTRQQAGDASATEPADDQTGSHTAQTSSTQPAAQTDAVQSSGEDDSHDEWLDDDDDDDLY